MPAYNASAYIREAVDSVLVQRFTDIELLVVDDGSTDGTHRILEDYQHQDVRVRVISQTNQGQSAARNRAIEESRGGFIAFLDSDDRWDPLKLELQIPLFKDKDVGLTFTGVQDIDANGKFIRGPQAWELHRGWILNRLLKSNFICCSSVMLRKSLLEKENLQFVVGRVCEDWLLWCQMSMGGKADFLDTPLVYYRVHAQGTSRNLRRMAEGEMACRRDMVTLLRNGPALGGKDAQTLLESASLGLHSSAYSFACRALREGDLEEGRRHWQESRRFLPLRIGRIWRVATFPLRMLLQMVLNFSLAQRGNSRP